MKYNIEVNFLDANIKVFIYSMLGFVSRCLINCVDILWCSESRLSSRCVWSIPKVNPLLDFFWLWTSSEVPPLWRLAMGGHPQRYNLFASSYGWTSSEVQPLWCLIVDGQPLKYNLFGVWLRVDDLRGTNSLVSSWRWTTSEVQPLWSLFVDGQPPRYNLFGA